MLRASGTEPMLRIYSETTSPATTRKFSTKPAHREACLGRIFHECADNLLCDANSLRRIALQCMKVLSSTGLQPVCRRWAANQTTQAEACALDRAGPALSLLAATPGK